MRNTSPLAKALRALDTARTAIPHAIRTLEDAAEVVDSAVALGQQASLVARELSAKLQSLTPKRPPASRINVRVVSSRPGR
jgi:hypothetical protein